MVKSKIIEHVDIIKELYNCDISIKNIASDVGVNQRCLGKYIKRHPEIFDPNIHRRYRRMSESESEEIYQDWLSSAKSIKDIAKERNLDPSTVRRHITMRLRK